MLECEFRKGIWNYFLSRLEIYVSLNGGVTRTITRIMGLNNSKGAKAILKSLVCVICSDLWYARNK